MKEVNIIPDDAKSAECVKQLEQVNFLYQFMQFSSDYYNHFFTSVGTVSFFI